MYEVSLEILRVNLEEFKKLRDKDVALTRAKYKNGRNLSSSPEDNIRDAEKMAVLGVLMAWEERISDISDAISALETIRRDNDGGNRETDASPHSVLREGEAKNASELQS